MSLGGWPRWNPCTQPRRRCRRASPVRTAACSDSRTSMSEVHSVLDAPSRGGKRQRAAATVQSMWMRSYSFAASRCGLTSHASPAPASFAALGKCRNRREARTRLRAKRRVVPARLDLLCQAPGGGGPVRTRCQILDLVRIRRKNEELQRIGIAMSVFQVAPPDHEHGPRRHCEHSVA